MRTSEKIKIKSTDEDTLTIELDNHIQDILDLIFPDCGVQIHGKEYEYVVGPNGGWGMIDLLIHAGINDGRRFVVAVETKVEVVSPLAVLRQFRVYQRLLPRQLSAEFTDWGEIIWVLIAEQFTASHAVFLKEQCGIRVLDARVITGRFLYPPVYPPVYFKSNSMLNANL